MSLAAHFDALAVYRASAVRIMRTNGEPEDVMSEGGGLQSSFDRLGRTALVGVLRDPDVTSVMLADGDLLVHAAREGSQAKLRVEWSGKAVVDQDVEIPSPQASWAGAWLRPGPIVSRAALEDLASPVHVVRDIDGTVTLHSTGRHGVGIGQLPLLGTVDPLTAAQLGHPDFAVEMGVRWAYVAGAMAGGITSAAMVIAMSNAGLLAFLGAGGLPVPAVEQALDAIVAGAKGAWGANLLHNPVEPAVEEATVDLYLAKGVRMISASAYMGLTPAVVRYRLQGIHRAADGSIVCPNRVFAKISRSEVAERFLAPAPNDILEALVARGALTSEQIELAKQVPVASCITAEADSGGHTDHRALMVILPQMLDLRDRAVATHGYATPVFVGAAGGLGTPTSIHGAFAMGADYVLTGSVNQATVEAGTSPLVKQMLAEAASTDVASGPAPDMFEIGAKVQVLSRGSMYAQRAAKLYELYKSVGDLDQIPEKERERLEKQVFKRKLADVWADTRSYWSERDPKQVQKAEADPRHKLALTFRWYLGMTSRWARMGDEDRKRDYQIWCGPAMGAFNAWAAGGPLEAVEARTVVGVAEALMNGAALEQRRLRLVAIERQSSTPRSPR